MRGSSSSSGGGQGNHVFFFFFSKVKKRRKKRVRGKQPAKVSSVNHSVLSLSLSFSFAPEEEEARKLRLASGPPPLRDGPSRRQSEEEKALDTCPCGAAAAVSSGTRAAGGRCGLGRERGRHWRARGVVDVDAFLVFFFVSSSVAPPLRHCRRASREGPHGHAPQVRNRGHKRRKSRGGKTPLQSVAFLSLSFSPRPRKPKKKPKTSNKKTATLSAAGSSPRPRLRPRLQHQPTTSQKQQ